MHQEAEMIKTNVDLSKPIFVSRTSLVYFHRTEMAFASDQLFSPAALHALQSLILALPILDPQTPYH